MKFCVDSIDLFFLVGANFELIEARDTMVSFKAQRINAHRQTAANPNDSDMEIDDAKITFAGFTVSELRYQQPFKKLSSGEVATQESYTLQGETAMDAFLELASDSFEVADFHQIMDGSYMLVTGSDGHFFVRLDFESARIEWDELSREANYELKKHYERTAQVIHDGEPEPAHFEIDVAKRNLHIKTHAILVYKGERYEGFGAGDDLWTEALADIQSKLPANTTIACCLTCRHGSMCPFGTGLDELFCLKDVVVHDKSDAADYTGDENEREKRARPFFYHCDDFQEQNDDYYTYNDYLPELQKKLARRGVH